MNELTTTTGNMMEIESKGFYCSLKAETNEDKVRIFNGQNNPDFRIKDEINMEIDVVGMIAEIVTLEKKDENDKPIINRETGEVEMNDAPRVILFDDKGKTHQCVSVGIFSAAKKLLSMFGDPNKWDAPLTIRVKNVNKGTRSMLSLEVVGFKKDTKKK